MTKIIGTLVVLFIYAVLVQFTNLIVYGYDFTAYLIPLVITFLYFTITLWWGKRKIVKELNYKVEVARTLRIRIKEE